MHGIEVGSAAAAAAEPLSGGAGFPVRRHAGRAAAGTSTRASGGGRPAPSGQRSGAGLTASHSGRSAAGRLQPGDAVPLAARRTPRAASRACATGLGPAAGASCRPSRAAHRDRAPADLLEQPTPRRRVPPPRHLAARPRPGRPAAGPPRHAIGRALPGCPARATSGPAQRAVAHRPQGPVLPAGHRGTLRTCHFVALVDDHSRFLLGIRAVPTKEAVTGPRDPRRGDRAVRRAASS